MILYDYIFYLFAAITVLSALFVVLNKNIVQSAFMLMFTFFGVTGLYVMLGADFIAIVQLMVYVGGIIVLMIFGVMLTHNVTSVQIKSGTFQIIPAGIIVLIFAGILGYSLFNNKWNTTAVDFPEATTKNLGFLLLNEYVIIFELLGMLLLIVLIGAATMARKG